MTTALTTYAKDLSMRFHGYVYLVLACSVFSCRSTHSSSSTPQSSPETAEAVVYTMDKGEKTFQSALPVRATDKRVEDMLAACAFSNTDIPSEAGFRASEMEFSVVYDRAQAEQGTLVATDLDIRLRPTTDASFSVTNDASDLTAKFNPAPTTQETPAAANPKAPKIDWNTVTVRALAPEGLAIKLTGTYNHKEFTAYCSGSDSPVVAEEETKTATTSTP